MLRLKKADVVIVEGTHNRFSQGYQMANALQAGKPVLLLYRPAPARSFSGLNHKLLTKCEYTTVEELDAIVQKFLRDFTPKKLELEVKIARNSKLQRYLEGQAERMGKTEDQILLDLATIGLKVRD